ncbi:hypothetical protein HNQ71_006460 [Mesorhizobium sangaii]|uniref:DDE domain-containing protein n=1 Tax=Mesorhizobium sangaii TaxID=505389 RepID=A0A841PIF2_9HYPH|nr:hypothetical protein [Mesorhizobium sangaii]
MYLYRAIDSLGDTVEFYFSENRDLVAAKRFLRKALARHGQPERIVIDGSQTNHEAILSCDAESRLRQRSRRPLKPIRIRTIVVRLSHFPRLCHGDSASPRAAGNGRFMPVRQDGADRRAPGRGLLSRGKLHHGSGNREVRPGEWTAAMMRSGDRWHDPG